MISNYLIDGDILYLYMTYQYEFSREFGTYSEDDLKILSRNFMRERKVPFHGNKIYFVVDGFVVKKIDLSDNKNLFYSPDEFLIQIELEDSSRCEISLREYLQSILFFYYSQDIGDEVLKCICVLYNTYAFFAMAKEGVIVANNSFGTYLPSYEYKEKYKNYEAILKRLNTIIDSCSSLFLAYQKEYILPFIHYSNSGRTLSNIKYPYLTSVKSLWDITSPTYLSIEDFDYSTLSQLLQVKLDATSVIDVIHNGQSMKFGYKTFSILELRNILHLKSNDISVIVNRGGIRVITRGVGNGLGLSIFGASCIESNGGNFEEILNYYFPKCTLYKNIKELS